jgi:lysozyme
MTYTDVYWDQYGDTMAITLGIDVSAYQGGIDWTAVAKTPYRFALARMTVGMGVHDDLGRANLSHMLGKIPVPGAYGVVGLADPVEAGADFLIDEIASVTDPKRVLVMLDAENYGDGRHPTIDQVDRYAIRIHQRIGRWPVAYVPAWWMRQHGYTAAGRALANCPWAPSHYLSAPWTEAKLLANKPPLEFGFKSLAWLQYTSSATVAGVSGNVDANCFYGTLDQLRAKLLGQQEDLSMADAQDVLNAIADLKATVSNGFGMVIRGDVTTDPTKETHPDNLQTIHQQLTALIDLVSGVMDPATQAALIAGQLEIVGVSTDTGGVISVTFGPKVAP